MNKVNVLIMGFIGVMAFACGTGTQTTSTSTSGSGGFGGEMSSSSSSTASTSSSGIGGNGGTGGDSCIPDQNLNCSKQCVIKDCKYCQEFGCTDETNVCYVGITHYKDMIGCLQALEVQSNCSACKDITTGSKIIDECVICAMNYSPCSFDCVVAVD